MCIRDSGEAIAVGLHGAMRLGAALDRVDESDADRVRDLLAAFGLPTSAVADPDDIRTFMAHDKKRLSGEQQWVLPVREGGVAIDRSVPESAVDAALRSVIRAGAG